MILEYIAERVRADGSVKLRITGHTDTTGSDGYNMALSLRHAASVRDELVRDGIDAKIIILAGKGSHDLMEPTGPGVRNERNRRAVIVLGDLPGLRAY